MKSIKREVQIRYPDIKPGMPNWHTIIVYDAQRTTDGRIVISYYDITDGYTDCYSEIIEMGGTWYKNPSHLNYDDYDFIYSGGTIPEIIMSLPEKIGLYEPNNQKNETLPVKAFASQLPPQPPTPPKKNIIVVFFANAGGSLVDLNPIYTENGISYQRQLDIDACTFICTTGPINYGVLQIPKNDKYELTNYIANTFQSGDRIDISSLRGGTFFTSSGVEYHYTCSSCADWHLFWQARTANNLRIHVGDLSRCTYPDWLSCALHYELPLDISYGNVVISNGVSKSSSTGTRK